MDLSPKAHNVQKTYALPNDLDMTELATLLQLHPFLNMGYSVNLCSCFVLQQLQNLRI